MLGPPPSCSLGLTLPRHPCWLPGAGTTHAAVGTTGLPTLRWLESKCQSPGLEWTISRPGVWGDPANTPGPDPIPALGPLCASGGGPRSTVLGKLPKPLLPFGLTDHWLRVARAEGAAELQGPPVPQAEAPRPCEFCLRKGVGAYSLLVLPPPPPDPLGQSKTLARARGVGSLPPSLGVAGRVGQAMQLLEEKIKGKACVIVSCQGVPKA